MPSKTLAADTLDGAIITAPIAGTSEVWTVTFTPTDTPGLTGTGLGATAPYDIIVDDASLEICHVTAVNVGTKQLTLTRGYAGSVSATHANGAVLKHIITGEYLNTMALTGDNPSAHHNTHATGGGDAVTLDEGQITGLTADLALKAPLDSPALTSIPTAPTAAPGTDTTQIATTAFAAAIGALAIPESQVTNLTTDLGTLTTDVATNVSAIALMAPLASPTFTGAPAAPTAAPSTNTTQLATTAFVAAQAAVAIPESQVTNLTADLAALAPLASPALTGTPTAPTAAPGTNTTQVATTAFSAAAIAALVASSPATLDTLNELALALGSDPNFATTITNLLALKAPLASPALTGTPTAPTATPGTNTTQLASTALW